MLNFKSYLKNKLKFNWQLGLFLILAFGIPRFIVVLSASKTGDYKLASIIFIVMWFLPFLLLSKLGRKQIGFTRPKKPSWLFFGFILGGLVCTLVWFLGNLLYGETINNWLVYISNSYQVPIDENFENVRFTYFLIFGITSMIFSPIGEELLYRGLIHRSFSTSMGENKASIIDSIAFAITHLAHFGVLFVAGNWEFRLLPALLWMLLMFITSRIFFYVKQKSGSILGAILSHAGFNLAMTYFIFYHIFKI